MRLRVLASLLFFSGCAALILEVGWFRRTAQVAGATSIALAAVLAAVIGGMALGAWWIGRRADDTYRPARLYGWLELGIAFFAIVSPWMLDASEAVFVELTSRFSGVPPLLTATRFVFSVILLTPPAVLMGGTLPAMAAAIRSPNEDLGRNLGWLYAWNTFGAAVGTLLAGFVLLPTLGLSVTIRLAAVLSGGAAIAAFLIDRHGTTTARSTHAPMFRVKQRARAVRIYAASGFLGLAAEASFARSLVLVFGSTTYAFTTILAVFLLGIAAGGAWGARLARNHTIVQRRLKTTLLWTAALFSIASYLSLHLPRLYLEGYLIVGKSFEAGIVLRFVLSFVILFPGAVGLGIAFPLAARIAGEDAAGEGTGKLYAANTVASVVGSTLAIFLLVPAFGPLRAVAVVALVIGALAFLTSRRLVLVIPLLLLGVGFLPPSRVALEHFLTGVYYAPERFLNGDRVDARAWDDGADVPFYEHGREATVSVLRWYGTSSVLVDGKAVATDQSVTDVQHLELLGHVPMVLHPDPRRVLVVGLGMGTTYKAVALHKPEHVVVVEIEGAVLAAAETLGVKPLEVVIDDARSYLRATDKRFEVITSDPIHPWVRGGGDLYTQEYFLSCRDRLSPDGIACQWLPLYQMGLDDVKAVLRTFASVFHTSVYFSGADLILVGTADPQTLTAHVESADVARSLMDIGAKDISDLKVMDHSGALRAAGEGPVLVDDALTLEFSAPRHRNNAEMAECLRWMLSHWPKPPRALDAIVRAMRARADGDADALSHWLDEANARDVSNGFVRRYSGETYLQNAARLVRDGDLAGAERFLGFATKRLPGDPRLLGVRADLLEGRGDKAGAAELLRELLKDAKGSVYLERRLKRLE